MCASRCTRKQHIRQSSERWARGFAQIRASICSADKQNSAALATLFALDVRPRGAERGASFGELRQAGVGGAQFSSTA